MIDSASFSHKEYYRFHGTLSSWRIEDLLDEKENRDIAINELMNIELPDYSKLKDIIEKVKNNEVNAMFKLESYVEHMNEFENTLLKTLDNL